MCSDVYFEEGWRINSATIVAIKVVRVDQAKLEPNPPQASANSPEIVGPNTCPKAKIAVSIAMALAQA
jgi:hypothetical protein